MPSFEKNLKKALDSKADGLDAATLSHLHQARNKALESATGGWHNSLYNILADILPWHQHPAAFAAITTGIAAAIIIVATSYYSPGTNLIQEDVVASPVEIMEIISLDADLELVEDLEFYNWLEEEHVETGA
jgi:hypothetical protein